VIEGEGVRAQLVTALEVLQASEHDVFLRTRAATGDDALLGIRGTVTITDIPIAPRPSVKVLTLREVALSEGRLQEGDLELVVAGTTTKAQLEAAHLLIASVEYDTEQVASYELGGVTVGHRVVARKRHRVD